MEVSVISRLDKPKECWNTRTLVSIPGIGVKYKLVLVSKTLAVIVPKEVFVWITVFEPETTVTFNKALPDDLDTFVNMFIDDTGLGIKNDNIFYMYII